MLRTGSVRSRRAHDERARMEDWTTAAGARWRNAGVLGAGGGAVALLGQPDTAAAVWLYRQRDRAGHGPLCAAAQAQQAAWAPACAAADRQLSVRWRGDPGRREYADRRAV